jgi:hypothetical protein
LTLFALSMDFARGWIEVPLHAQCLSATYSDMPALPVQSGFASAHPSNYRNTAASVITEVYPKVLPLQRKSDDNC